MVASLEKTKDYLCRHIMPEDQALSKEKEKIENNFAVNFELQQSPLLPSSNYLKFEEHKPNKDMVVYFYSKVVWTIR
jgi:hypothetical protein